jgi:DegV family protein with EDD domain
MAVHIFTDSTADLGPELSKRYDIGIIPLYVNVDGKTYTDGISINTPDLFRSVEETGQLPKTSAPTVPDFEKRFAQPGKSIFMGISSKLSATYQNAVLAQQTFEPGRVFVVDTLNLSTGIGLLAIKAAEWRDAGLPAADIARQVSDLVPKVHTSFVIETMDYLYKGGRCSALQSMIGGLLHIRPVISVRADGSLGVKGRTRGARMKALQFMLDDFCDSLEQVDTDRVFVTHTSCQEDAEYLSTALRKLAPIREVHITNAGSVIASHCGPGTIGILYLTK